VTSFTRSDGAVLHVLDGFRDQLLTSRASITPRPAWTDSNYQSAAETKRKRLKRLVMSLKRWCGDLNGARALDVGCGDGANCLLLALEERVEFAVGIDLALPFLIADERRARTERLLSIIRNGRLDLPVRFLEMDGTQMAFVENSFDLVLSRSAMEHIRPIDRALGEMVRVTRPGGLIYLGIDPFFWLRGCHKRGVVDIPWAHARLSLDEFARFVALTEGNETAQKRWTRLETLNRLTVKKWRECIEKSGCEVLAWQLKQSDSGAQLLAEHPEIEGTLLPGVTRVDLLTERIEVWLRKK
jgi:ubiquinone/menaquinone biosynthesis C-methylase UbiE